MTNIERNVLPIGASKERLPRRGAAGRVGGASVVAGASVINQGSSFDATTAPSGALPIPMRTAPQGAVGLNRDVGRARRFSEVDPVQATRNVRARTLGGTTDAQMGTIAQWVPRAPGSLPTVGTTPSFQTSVRAEQGIPMFGGFGPNGRVGSTGIVPTAKAGGTGGVAFAGFTGRPTRYDTSVGRAVVRDAASAGATMATGASAMAGAPWATHDWSRAGNMGAETATLGFMTNYTIPYSLRLHPSTYKYNRHMQRHQLILELKGGDPSVAKKIRSAMASRVLAGQGGGADLHHMYNLQTFNFLQAITDTKPPSMFEARTADEVWANWALTGVVSGDEATALDTSTTTYAEAASGRERSILAVVGGCVDTVNIWGDVQTNTHLWLILKKVPAENIRASRVAEAGTYVLDPTTGAVAGTENLRKANRALSKCPFQLVPYASVSDNDGLPPPGALEYFDDHGVRRYGKAIYVGRVEDQRTLPQRDEPLLRAAPYNTRAVCGLLPVMRVRLSIDGKTF